MDAILTNYLPPSSAVFNIFTVISFALFIGFVFSFASIKMATVILFPK